MQLVSLHLPTLPGLPTHLYATNGLPLDLMFGMAEPEFANILSSIKPDLLIYDFLQPWAPLAASVQNIPAVEFITSSSTMTSFLFHHLKRPAGKKFVLVDSLVQEPSLDDENPDIVEWLNKKEKKSTVFVSFGSEYFHSKEDTEEIARGLEPSNINFIWVVRFPKDVERKLEETLPKGYLERVSDRGLAVERRARS
ncbi:beta-D-glucosyl crocetin beta-1,6-glucosyltransferase-like [Olea europaea subsp. europaea]|uniref:Beta-D-glucosyl crocetin beta-1,6-glucosyltransferase-like n=1 Tax=Olea europaea subsp. europaea TaxID=158383 RepID=A0A8S0TMQ0_OLEEU|nr:beta-D-glucosyl crocetin beta-1,6-glucosyltransferase-like [Olea europaea subsp. europaea]